MIKPHHLKRAYGYGEYKNLIEQLLAQGKTTGHDQSEQMIGYAKVNLQRMLRVEKNLTLPEDVRGTLALISRSSVWLVITEGWCGDSAQITPVLNAIARLSPRIDLRLLLRDDNPDVMEQYLTNGARSIPKLVCLEKESLREIFTWGPRPAELQQMVMQLVKDNVPKEEKGLIVQKWYNADGGRAIVSEIMALVKQHLCR